MSSRNGRLAENRVGNRPTKARQSWDNWRSAFVNPGVVAR
jgi:hypothetical protein